MSPVTKQHAARRLQLRAAQRATLPEPYRFRAEDYGIASFTGSVTLRTPGVQEVYAYDVETLTVFGYAAIEVGGGAGMGGGGEAQPAFDSFTTAALALSLLPARQSVILSAILA
jgi:hypothetical protein